jgi:hypothetical protein
MMLFERFPGARLPFAVAWLAAQVALLATAGGRINHSFGFRMFDESALTVLHVERRVDGGSLPIDDRWTARDCQGVPHEHVWKRLVPAGPYVLDHVLIAAYGADSAEARAKAVVQWVARHVPDDCETHAFDAVVSTVKNGRPRPDVRFTVTR